MRGKRNEFQGMFNKYVSAKLRVGMSGLVLKPKGDFTKYPKQGYPE